MVAQVIPFNRSTGDSLDDYQDESYNSSTLASQSAALDYGAISDEHDEHEATPQGLYTADDTGIAASKIIDVVEKVNQSINNLDNALNNYEDEIEREIQLDLFRYNLSILNALKDIDQNFGDVITAIQVCIANKGNSVFSEIEIVKLKSVFQIMKNNFNMSEKVLDECINLLDDYFDLFIPMDVEFNEF